VFCGYRAEAKARQLLARERIWEPSGQSGSQPGFPRTTALAGTLLADYRTLGARRSVKTYSPQYRQWSSPSPALHIGAIDGD
jgi:hypothetical protein